MGNAAPKLFLHDGSISHLETELASVKLASSKRLRERTDRRTIGRTEIQRLSMITAYIDESGTHQDSTVLVLAAYIGTYAERQSAEERFRRANKYAGRIIHAVDCAQGGRDFREFGASAACD